MIFSLPIYGHIRDSLFLGLPHYNRITNSNGNIFHHVYRSMGTSTCGNFWMGSLRFQSWDFSVETNSYTIYGLESACWCTWCRIINGKNWWVHQLNPVETIDSRWWKTKRLVAEARKGLSYVFVWCSSNLVFRQNLLTSTVPTSPLLIYGGVL